MEILVLNYTERCNSRCTTCDIWRIREPKTLSLADITRILSSQRMAGLRNLYMTGGEPFLADECVGIAEILARTHPGATISGATNCLEPDAYLRRMIRIGLAGVLVVPSISLNGRPDVHDATRGLPGNYEACMRMRYLLTTYRIPYNIAYLQCGQELEDRDHVYALAREWGVAVVETRQRFSRRLNTPHRPDPVFSFACRAPVDICCVWPNGDVTACEEDDPKLYIGNIHTQSLDEMDFDAVAAYVAAGNCRPCTMGCFEGK